MAGTVIGGKTAAKTNKEKHGADFYKRIGAMGGKKGTTGGFYANRELAKQAGRKGGKKSRRGPAEPKADKTEQKVERAAWVKKILNRA